MNTFTISQDIISYINTNWTATPKRFPNQPFDQVLSNTTKHYIEIDLLFNRTDKIEAGSGGAVNINGLLACRVIGRKNVGTGPQQQIADTFATMFSDKVIGSVHFIEATVENGREVENRWQQNITIPFNQHQDP